MASTHLHLANEIPDQVSLAGGTLGVYNMFAGGTDHLTDNDRLSGGIYYGHVDGLKPSPTPMTFASLQERCGSVMMDRCRWLQRDGYGHYHGEGNMTTGSTAARHPGGV